MAGDVTTEATLKVNVEGEKQIEDLNSSLKKLASTTQRDFKAFDKEFSALVGARLPSIRSAGRTGTATAAGAAPAAQGGILRNFFRGLREGAALELNEWRRRRREATQAANQEATRANRETDSSLRNLIRTTVAAGTAFLTFRSILGTFNLVVSNIRDTLAETAAEARAVRATVARARIQGTSDIGLAENQAALLSALEIEQGAGEAFTRALNTIQRGSTIRGISGDAFGLTPRLLQQFREQNGREVELADMVLTWAKRREELTKAVDTARAAGDTRALAAATEETSTFLRRISQVFGTSVANVVATETEDSIRDNFRRQVRAGGLGPTQDWEERARLGREFQAVLSQIGRQFGELTSVITTDALPSVNRFLNDFSKAVEDNGNTIAVALGALRTAGFETLAGAVRTFDAEKLRQVVESFTTAVRRFNTASAGETLAGWFNNFVSVLDRLPEAARTAGEAVEVFVDVLRGIRDTLRWFGFGKTDEERRREVVSARNLWAPGATAAGVPLSHSLPAAAGRIDAAFDEGAATMSERIVQASRVGADGTVQTLQAGSNGIGTAMAQAFMSYVTANFGNLPAPAWVARGLPVNVAPGSGSVGSFGLSGSVGRDAPGTP